MDPAQLLVLKEALLKRKPARAGGGEEAALTRDDRFALTMAAMRGVADLAASSEASYRLCLAGLAALKVTIQRGPHNTAAGGPGRGASGRLAGGLATSAADSGDGGGAEGERCHSCWGFGHRRTNQACPRFKMSALPKPGSVGRNGRKREQRGGVSAEGSGDSSASDSGNNDTTCHKCSEPGDLLCCSTCPRSWHSLCLPEDAMAPGDEGSDWSCPVCTRSAAPAGFVGNPPNKRAKGAQRQKRIKPAHEASKAEKRVQKAAAKAAAPAGQPPRYR